MTEKEEDIEVKEDKEIPKSPPIEVKIIEEEKEEEEDPTSWVDEPIYNYTPTEEQIKEMTDAQ